VKTRIRRTRILLGAVVIAALVVAPVSGVGLVLAAVGFRRERGWRERWCVWLPSVFGASLAVCVIAFVLLLVSGID
jgi:hypothetical protein